MTETSQAVATLRPEWQLLLATARVSLEPDRADRVRALLRQPLDWPWLLDMAAGHATTALLARHLTQAAPNAVPADVLSSLRDWSHDNACRNLYMTGELFRTLSLFAARGVRVVPFKGPTLAAQVYGNLVLRRFVDLDLLVAPADLPRARALLAELGYHSLLSLAPAEEDAYLATVGQMPFVNEGETCMVELHARIAPRDFHFPLGLASLWPRLGSVSLMGREVCTLSGEDLLLVLCAHGAKHGWRCLGWVCDVAELLRTGHALDWPAVHAEARGLHCERLLLLGLLLAHDVLQAPVPQRLLRRARAAATVRALAAAVIRRLPHDGGVPALGLRNALFQLRARERLRDGVRYALSLALTPTVADWTAVRAPASLSFVHYLLRPLRLAGKYGQLLWRSRRPTGPDAAPQPCSSRPS
jgi:hypothetical protein